MVRYCVGRFAHTFLLVPCVVVTAVFVRPPKCVVVVCCRCLAEALCCWCMFVLSPLATMVVKRCTGLLLFWSRHHIKKTDLD